MILKDNRNELNLNLKLRVDDFDYTVFVSTDVMKCFGCGKTGHLVHVCPDKNGTNAQDVSSENGVQVGEEESTDNVPDPSQAEPRPSTSNITDTEPLSKTEEVNQASEKNHGENELVVTVVARNESKADENMDISHVSVGLNKMSPSESENLGDSLMMDMDQAVFKTPLKRKKKDKVSESKQARKAENEKESDVEDVGSESDFSDSGASSCSQNEWTCKDYDTEEIRKFLNLTKNLRGVQVADYFPDIKRFVENTRMFMSEGCFTNKEVYRLKKFVTKLQNQLSLMAVRLLQFFALIGCLFLYGLSLLFYFSMGDIRIASLNVNGARDRVKRSMMYELMGQKKIYVLLVQETHSDVTNAVEWGKRI